MQLWINNGPDCSWLRYAFRLAAKADSVYAIAKSAQCQPGR